MTKHAAEIQTGMIVRVFHDPLTCEKIEGSGIIVRIYDRVPTLSGDYRVDVLFLGEGELPVRRTVHVDDVEWNESGKGIEMARELMHDYTSADFDGVTYYYRA